MELPRRDLERIDKGFSAATSRLSRLPICTIRPPTRSRNRLSEDILQDVKEIAGRYGVAILRADVKDLVFPGNLQEIMNKVLAAERMSEALLIEARTKAQTQQIDAQAQAEMRKVAAAAQAESQRLAAMADAQASQVRTEAEVAALRQAEQAAAAYSIHPALLRLRELEALKDLAKSASARIYIGFDRHGSVLGEVS
jgi:regulator of protease activity HflC (stomatin/prohibitin superfamily)